MEVTCALLYGLMIFIAFSLFDRWPSNIVFSTFPRSQIPESNASQSILLCYRLIKKKIYIQLFDAFFILLLLLFFFRFLSHSRSINFRYKYDAYFLRFMSTLHIHVYFIAIVQLFCSHFLSLSFIHSVSHPKIVIRWIFFAPHIVLV